MSLLKQKNRKTPAGQIADKIKILKNLTGGSGSILNEDVNSDCWFQQLEIIESFISEVPEAIASVVDSLLKTNGNDRKCLRSWRKQILNQFRAMVNALKGKIDKTMMQIDAISHGMKEEEYSEVKHEQYAVCNSMKEMFKNTTENQMKEEYGDQISNYCQVKIEENITIHNLSPNYDSSSDEDRPLSKTNSAPKFACLDCSDVLTSLRALHIHRRQVHCEPKPHKCNRCPLAFKHHSTLRRHQRTPHNREKQQQYLCDLCPQVCPNKNKFKAHRRTHTGESRFVCDICSRSLGTKNCLVTHMRTHTDER